MPRPITRETQITEVSINSEGKGYDSEDQAMRRGFVVQSLKRIVEHLEGDAFDTGLTMMILDSVQGDWDAGSTVFLRLDLGP